MKKTFSFLILLAVLLLQCSCTRRANQLADRTNAALAEHPPTQLSMQMEIAAEIAGTPADLALRANTSLQKASGTSYTDFTLSRALHENQRLAHAEIYLREEDGQTAAYIRSDDTWTRQEMDSCFHTAAASALPDAVFSLDAGCISIDGQPCRVLRCTYSGEELGRFAASQLQSLPLSDWSELRISSVYYVDAKTNLLRQIELDISGADAAASALLAAHTGSEIPTIRLHRIHIVWNEICYDPVDIPLLPADALSPA